MKTLFPHTFDWFAYLVTAIIVRLAFFGISWFSYLAIMISIQQFILLFTSIRFIIPTRYLLGMFMCIQFFIGPVLAYNGLDQYQYFLYKMRIPEEAYFAYAIPAVVLFIIGTHIRSGQYRGEVIDQKRIAVFVDRHPMLPYIFIGIGFLASVVADRFSAELAFVFYLLGSFKFIGLFMLVLGTKQLKLLPLILVMGTIVASSLASGMFHDLITWTVFTAAIFAIKYKFDFKIKIIGLSSFMLIALTIQVLKGSFRKNLSSETNGTNGAETFAKLVEQKSENGGLFNLYSLASSAVRINQGFIITNIMHTIPDLMPYEHGKEMMLIIESAVLPRVLAPNKLNAGDRAIFSKYSRIPVAPGTSMGLSSLGDAYINWGVFGGCIFMFFLGFFYCEILNVFHKYGRDYPVLILFTTLVFYYPIRPDCELQTILGHVVKSLFLIFVMFQVWKRNFFVPRNISFKKTASPPNPLSKGEGELKTFTW